MSHEDGYVCAKCHEDYSLRENCEPSDYCDRCVHDVLSETEAQLSAALAKVAELEQGNARLTRRCAAGDAAVRTLLISTQPEPPQPSPDYVTRGELVAMLFKCEHRCTTVPEFAHYLMKQLEGGR